MKKFLKHNVGKAFEFLCNCHLLFDVEEPLTSFKFENFDYILKLSAYVDNATKDLLSINFTKVKP